MILVTISGYFRFFGFAPARRLPGLLVFMVGGFLASPKVTMAASKPNDPNAVPPAVVALLKNAPPCPETGLSIRITVTNVKSSKGIITADLHGDNPADFLKEIVGRGRAFAVKGETHVCIPVKKPGIYAIALYHDKNSNLQLDKNWLGIPNEPIGISNNPRFGLGPPKFKDSSFQVTDTGADLVIKLRNAL